MSEDECCVDIDDNYYETVWIGDQLWMAENLKVTQYNDGSEILTGFDGAEWWDLNETEIGAYALYDDDPVNAETYGNLYNWYAVADERGICPAGWHVPTDDEFKELEIFLGMSEADANSTGWNRGTNEGSKLAGSGHLWIDNDLEENFEFAESGFNAIPAGYRDSSFDIGINSNAYFWSSEQSSTTSAFGRWLSYTLSLIHRYDFNTRSGYSVRCIQD